MRPQDLLASSRRPCCMPGVHIDPVRSVERAVITHGIPTTPAQARCRTGDARNADMMQAALWRQFRRQPQAIAYGEELRLGDSRIKIFTRPRGHVLGRRKSRCPARHLHRSSGDYKDAPHPTCTPFEVVPCDVFITEATFGLPCSAMAMRRMTVKSCWHRGAVSGGAHLVGAYSLGKAQRVIALLRLARLDAPIYLHGAMGGITSYYQSRGVALGDCAGQGREEGRFSGRHHHGWRRHRATSDIWTRRFPVR